MRPPANNPERIPPLRRNTRRSTLLPARTTPSPQHAPPPQPTQTDRRMMRHALTLARHAASIGEVPVGAVVWNTTTAEIIATGFNTRERDKDPSAHAEYTAITRACQRTNDWRLTDHALAVTLEPCPMCAGLIVNTRLSRVVYGAHDPKAGACRSLFTLIDDPRLNHRTTPITGVYAEESAALLKDFFRARRDKRTLFERDDNNNRDT